MCPSEKVSAQISKIPYGLLDAKWPLRAVPDLWAACEAVRRRSKRAHISTSCRIVLQNRLAASHPFSMELAGHATRHIG